MLVSPPLPVTTNRPPDWRDSFQTYWDNIVAGGTYLGGGAYPVCNYHNIVDLITKYCRIVDTFHEITGLRLSRSLITEYRANFT